MAQKPIVLYDDTCLFCLRTKRRFERLDSKRKLKWIGISKFNYKKFRLKKDDLLKEIHLIDGKKVYKGYHSFKNMCRHIPLLYFLYLLMLIPGIDWIGNKMYHWVSAHRYML